MPIKQFGYEKLYDAATQWAPRSPYWKKLSNLGFVLIFWLSYLPYSSDKSLKITLLFTILLFLLTLWSISNFVYYYLSVTYRKNCEFCCCHSAFQILTCMKNNVFNTYTARLMTFLQNINFLCSIKIGDKYL
jgi:hypothetical protein